jgi:hypothetical protein
VSGMELLRLDLQRGQALRVLSDGRYEFRGDVEPEIGEDGEVSLRKVPLEWRLQWTFAPDELDQLRTAIDEADDPPLEPRYTAGRQIHGRNLTWTLHTSRRTARVEVQGWPAAQPAALERLYRRLFEIHRPPGETSVWRLWTGAGATEKLVPCEPGSVPRLQGVVAALFGSGDEAPPEGAETVELPPDDTPLAEVAFRRDGEEFERLSVYGDGRQTQVLDGERRELDALPPERVQALRAAIAAAGWDGLPDRLC